MKLLEFSPLSIPGTALLFLSFLFLHHSAECFRTSRSVASVAGSKILGGEVAADKSFPFQVYLEFPNPTDSGRVSVCGGSIIKHSDNLYKILTSAHCCDKILKNNKPSDKDLLVLVIMGANNVVTQINRGKVLRIKFGLVTIHPNYNEATNENDLAIIPLPADFKPVPGLYDAIKLAPSSDVDKNYAGTEVQTAGWGVYNAEGDDSDLLLFIRSKILTDEACEEARVTAGSSLMYNNKFLCIDGTGNKMACSGDSGASLIAGTPSVVVGVSSYRLPEHCEGSEPSYFIRVVKYLDWINTTI